MSGIIEEKLEDKRVVVALTARSNDSRVLSKARAVVQLLEAPRASTLHPRADARPARSRPGLTGLTGAVSVLGLTGAARDGSGRGSPA